MNKSKRIIGIWLIISGICGIQYLHDILRYYFATNFSECHT